MPHLMMKLIFAVVLVFNVCAYRFGGTAVVAETAIPA
jgi:hypothetical protein